MTKNAHPLRCPLSPTVFCHGQRSAAALPGRARARTQATHAHSQPAARNTRLPRLQSLSQLKAQGMVDDTLPGEPMEKRLARLVAANPALRAHVPTLYREQLHMEAFFDVFFAADLLDVMLSLTGKISVVWPSDGPLGSAAGARATSLCRASAAGRTLDPNGYQISGRQSAPGLSRFAHLFRSSSPRRGGNPAVSQLHVQA